MNRTASTAPPDTPRRRWWRIRGPFTRWPRTADAVLAAVMFVLTATVTFDGPDDSLVLRGPGDVPLAILAVFAVATAALAWRRRRPVVVLAVTVTAWALTLGSGYADLGGVTIVALYSAGRHSTSDCRGQVGTLAAVGVAVADGITGPQPWGEGVFAAVVMFVAWYVGRRVRLRGERAVQLERERVAEARRIVAEERTRIARELHDVVAHRVSLMTVQAGAAKAVATHDLPAALAAMGAVEEAGRQALDELRHLLGVLRPDTDPDGLGPQPGLADLPRLVTEVAGTGIDVRLTMDDALPTPLPARVDLFAYRIAQEALTNVVKHAGPHARVQVRVGASDGGRLVVLEVADDGGGTAHADGPGPARGGGHGVVGMRERALLLGGTLQASPRPGRGFDVVARLPVGGEPT